MANIAEETVVIYIENVNSPCELPKVVAEPGCDLHIARSYCVYCEKSIDRIVKHCLEECHEGFIVANDKTVSLFNFPDVVNRDMADVVADELTKHARRHGQPFVYTY